MNYYEQIQDAKAYIEKKASTSPTVGIVLGSGLGAFADAANAKVTVPYGEVPHFPQSSVAGHAGTLVLGEIHGVSCAIMSGRVHYYEGYDMQRVTFPVRVLAALGVKKLLVTNAAGASNADFVPGDMMVIVDHLNLTGDHPLRGENDERLGPRFPDMSEAYAKSGRQALHQAARGCQVSLKEGVYAGLAGPSYETPAEVRMLQRLGADAVGMSTVAEVIAARHGGLEVAGLSVITNRAAGLSATALSHEEVKEVGKAVEKVLCQVLAQAIATWK